MQPDGWNVIRDFIDVLARRGLRTALYRGQADITWPVVPSIYRGNPGIRASAHLQDWKIRASRFASPMPLDDIEWLILAQHYGLATPLLDWTTSPLTALYFACEGQTQADGTVWWIRRSEFDIANYTLMIKPFADSRDRPVLINAIGRNIRSTAQDSYLSLHTETDCRIIPAERIFTVSAASKEATLDALSKLGFDGERLHHDITKLVERFKREAESRRFTL